MSLIQELIRELSRPGSITVEAARRIRLCAYGSCGHVDGHGVFSSMCGEHD
jgi:hypothetical protein